MHSWKFVGWMLFSFFIGLYRGHCFVSDFSSSSSFSQNVSLYIYIYTHADTNINHKSSHANRTVPLFSFTICPYHPLPLSDSFDITGCPHKTDVFKFFTTLVCRYVGMHKRILLMRLFLTSPAVPSMFC